MFHSSGGGAVVLGEYKGGGGGFGILIALCIVYGIDLSGTLVDFESVILFILVDSVN